MVNRFSKQITGIGFVVLVGTVIAGEYPIPEVVSNVTEIGYVRISDIELVAKAKAEHPGQTVGFVASIVKNGSEGYDDRPVRDREIFAAIRAGLDYFEFDTPLPDVVSIQMHDAGVKTVRVITDPEDVRSDADLGVKYLVSPDPERTRRVLKGLQERMQGPVSADDFRIRDPFVLADEKTKTYYLYETTPWNVGRGVNVRTSGDLKTWSAPKRVMTMPANVRCRSVWAPEVHAYAGAYYLFATPTLEPDPAFPIRSMADDPAFAPPECYALTRRGTWIWKSDSPAGPFSLISDMSATPHDMVALDGTLSVDSDGTPWMVYSHCWTQVKMGRVEAARLKPDLSGLAEKPQILFKADAAFGDNHVMDGPFLYRSPKSGSLFMIWSKFCASGYSVVSCRSASGGVAGPWVDFRMVFPGNGGHGMIFRTFDGKLKLVMHKPEIRGRERLAFFDLEDTGESLAVIATVAAAHGDRPQKACAKTPNK